MRSTCFFFVLLAVAAPLRAEQTPIWQTQWKVAFKIAKEEHRLVFVDYFAFSCTPSTIMEETVMSNAEVQKRLNDFVLLREDFSRGYDAPNSVSSIPKYVVYDQDERERFRFPDVDPSVQAQRGQSYYPRPFCWDRGLFSADIFSGQLDMVRHVAPSFVRAAELLDSGNELEAYFLLGNTYVHAGNVFAGDAREMYEKARELAEKNGNKAIAQMAAAESALTLAREKDYSHAIKLLQELAANPADRKTEAFIWLALGRAYQMAKDPKAARSAYQRTQSLAAPDSAAFKEAEAELVKLH